MHKCKKPTCDDESQAGYNFCFSHLERMRFVQALRRDCPYCGSETYPRDYCLESNTAGCQKCKNIFVVEKGAGDCMTLFKKKEPEDRQINHPPHYTAGKIETIDVITDWKLNYCEGNVIKYLSRYKHKGSPLEDLKKAEWYLKRLIEENEN